MNLPIYKLKTNRSFSAFKFISEGSRGNIPKGVTFTFVEADVYNIALGDIDATTGYMNDMARSDNGDTEKILSTVARCIYMFLEQNPEASVFMQGSTESRTRLYRMAINKFWEDISDDFTIMALHANQWQLFEKDSEVKYDAFLIKRKKK